MRGRAAVGTVVALALAYFVQPWMTVTVRVHGGGNGDPAGAAPGVLSLVAAANRDPLTVSPFRLGVASETMLLWDVQMGVAGAPATSQEVRLTSDIVDMTVAVSQPIKNGVPAALAEWVCAFAVTTRGPTGTACAPVPPMVADMRAAASGEKAASALPLRLTGLNRAVYDIRSVALHALSPDAQASTDDPRWLAHAAEFVESRLPPLPLDAHSSAMRLAVQAHGPASDASFARQKPGEAALVLNVSQSRDADTRFGADDGHGAYPQVAVLFESPWPGSTQAASPDQLELRLRVVSLAADDGKSGGSSEATRGADIPGGDVWERVCVIVHREHGVHHSGRAAVLGPTMGCFPPGSLEGGIGGMQEGVASLGAFAVNAGGAVVSLVATTDFTVSSDTAAVAASREAAEVAAAEAAAIPTARHALSAGDAAPSRSTTVGVDGALGREVRQSEGDVTDTTNFTCTVPFAVVIVGLPEEQNANIRVFEIVARATHEGLLELGCESLRIDCPDLRYCSDQLLALGREGWQVILMGSNSLHLYGFTPTGSDTKVPLVLSNEVVPSDSILYNFEYLTRQDEQGQYKQSWVNDDFVDVHRAFTVWEYSYANQVKWRSEYGIEPVMVPIGYVPSMHVSDPQPEAEKDIDVLFDGTSNPYREAVIGEIVGAGINVVWRAMWGDEYYELVSRAKIVLSLNSFGTSDEFKMHRFIKLLPNKAFVVSEEGGVAEDVAYYRPGVMFVERADMPAALKFYLGRPELRDRVAETGQQLLKAAPQSKFLLSAVRDIVRQRTCGAACA